VSSIDAKEKAFMKGIKEVVWLWNLSTRIQGISSNPIPLFCDNQSTLKVAKNPVYHEQLKHIKIWLHFIRENVVRGTIKALYVPTREQVANILTKSLGKQRFWKLREEMGICSVSSLWEH